MTPSIAREAYRSRWCGWRSTGSASHAIIRRAGSSTGYWRESDTESDMTRRHLLAVLPFSIGARRAKAADPTFERIDTHTHMHRSAPAMLAALAQANWRCLSICDVREIGDQPTILDEMIRGTKVLHAESKGRIAWATTFDARPFETPNFAERVIAALQRDFDEKA